MAVAGAQGLAHRARRLQYFTIGYNVVEAVISIAFGVAGSVLALVAFGIDSAIEVTASLAVLVRLRYSLKSAVAERRAQRLVALCFFALAGTVLFHGVRNLLSHEGPEETLPAVLIAVVSGLVMPVLARMKRNVAVQMNLPSLAAEAAQTKLCAYLTYILLGAMILNRWFGWWWADAAGSLLMVPIITYEGVKAARGESCECH